MLTAVMDRTFAGSVTTAVSASAICSKASAHEAPMPRKPTSAPCLKCSHGIVALPDFLEMSASLVSIAERLRASLASMRFGGSVRHVYDPLVYAWTTHCE